MARPKRVEGAAATYSAEGTTIITGNRDVDAISAGVADFKARFPEDWEALRLCPLQHGLDAMIEKLAK